MRGFRFLIQRAVESFPIDKGKKDRLLKRLLRMEQGTDE